MNNFNYNYFLYYNQQQLLLYHQQFFNILPTIYEYDNKNDNLIVIPKKLNYKRLIFYDYNIIKNSNIDKFIIYEKNDKFLTILSKPYNINNLLNFIITNIYIIKQKKLEVILSDRNLDNYNIFNNDYSIKNIKYIYKSIAHFIKNKTNILLYINIIINQNNIYNHIIFDIFNK